MATSLAVDKPHLPPASADATDPFVSPPGPAHQRYSSFDNQSFALGAGSSPGQAKRALQAHIADTERRLDEAGKLGTALVQQRKELAERLKEVEEHEAEGELAPELRAKLADIEKEYQDVARETARAFLPKQRVPSNEAAGGSPYVPDGRIGRRSVSPSKFEKLEVQATGSPSKLNIPNRKVRNQPANRIHDIEFAAEISTSLIAQVRNLQSLLSEKDEELRDIKVDKSRLEIENENFQQRVKTLDESENRYKDENWNLETQVHDLIAAQKDAADREKKLSQSLNVLQAEKNSAQKELDEAKVSLAKLAEEHERAVKHLDLDLTTSKRNAASAETERNALRRKVDDLMSQNTELAKAISVQRGRLSDRDFVRGVSDEDLEAATDGFTPEHSPPPSPIKGTPRHAMLESETLKSSLLHAQRTIQSQKTVIHREKTEKLELKRLLQDTRDELEKLRTDAAPVPARRNRKVESREFKKPSRGLLGGHRSSRNEVYQDDPDWEEATEIGSPRTSPTVRSNSTIRRPNSRPGSSYRPQFTDVSDQFETANETSDAAFETANERGTETEDFQTGIEDFSGDDTETETESPSKGRELRPQVLAMTGGRNSYDSTASTSADEEEEYVEYRTPTSQHSHQRMRVKMSRGIMNRRSRQLSEDPSFQGSPASAATGSAVGTPQPGGQSLFAELADLETSDAESVEGTPNRSRSATGDSTDMTAASASSVPALSHDMADSGSMTDPVKRAAASKPAMVDSGMMTEPMTESPPLSPASVVHEERSVSMGSMLAAQQLSRQLSSDETTGIRSRPLSTLSYSDAGAQYDVDMDAKLAQFPMPPFTPNHYILPPSPELTLSSIDAQDIEPVIEPETPLPPPPELSLTSLVSEVVEPKAEPKIVPPTPVLAFTPLVSENVEPKAEPEVPPPTLSISTYLSETIEPLAEPEVPPPVLTLSALHAHNLEPVAVPETPLPTLTLSALHSRDLEPVAEPAMPPLTLSLSALHAHNLEPVAEPETPPPTLTLSALHSHNLEPVVEPETVPLVPDLTLSALVSENIEPKEDPEESQALALVPAPIPVAAPVPAPTLTLSWIASENVEPREEAEVPVITPVLSLSAIATEHVEPVAEPEVVTPAAPVLSLSALHSHNLEPRAEPEVLPPALSLSSIVAEGVEPKAEPEIIPEVPTLSFSLIAAENIEPKAEPEVVVPLPVLSLTPISSEDIEPKAEPAPVLTVSSISFADIEPLAEPDVPAPAPPALSLSSISSEDIEPKAEPETPEPTPAVLAYSDIHSEHVEPRAVPLPALDFSAVLSQHVEPVVAPETVAPKHNFAFSTIESIETQPISPRSPKRDAFILPRDMESRFDEKDTPRTPPKTALMNSALGRGKNKTSDSPIIAEDDTRQSPSESRLSETPESQRPFKEISSNTNGNGRTARKPMGTMSDSGAQTSLTAEAIDEMLLVKTKATSDKSLSSFGTPSTPGTVRIRRPSHDSLSSFSTENKMDAAFKRPGSANSNLAPAQPLPPLPSNHKEAIEAARSGSSHGSAVMGPPLWPASAMRSQRPQTPNDARPQSPLSISTSTKATPTVRVSRAGAPHTTVEVHSPTKLSTMSRHSSVSSFVSEIDHRFNPQAELAAATGFGPNTDPRMIQAITQTMIGEYLWKYTRKAGRGEISDYRHRRYFWVHPYTRTLYWSDRDPATAGRSELRGKSVPIEAVRVVTDDNPMPPGLHRKSLIVISPGRTIKFTCTTGQRHETWFNALSYLLLRTANEGQSDVEEMAGHITQADVDEFNPQFGRRTNSTARQRPPPSLSSYNSRTTRNQSPAIDMSMNMPTLTPNNHHAQAQRPAIGTLGRISGYFGTFSSLRSRSAATASPSIYEASEVHDSAEDLREIIERQDRDADRLENVRACCDGKHDVGTLHHHSKRGRPSASHSHSHSNSHSGPSTATPLSTLKARA
ncbi:PH domain-containing protein [Colletotrichum higginsianum]|uniref:PH domain-containing protein n=1 Tax=Colletotrichum higginsianum (strain IMI 349063) TaxID=759273 RepID=H1V3B5_COLHI|nr:PH domain-containing protein [Colletotrichum higginsianum IMI 349063]OBR05842.1 PH domain-containing protein [Colletotrichum higginsianum IMI 349063]CCF34717.1 PH domain-containing protein [Colletotrichum higginsianum]